jgi:hypothetical protein
VSDRERNGMGQSAARLNCPACGHLYTAGDRFCAECGAALPPVQAPAREQPENGWAASPPAPVTSIVSEPMAESDGGFWVLGAAPTSVIGGGILLLLLAAILLFVGQMDKTGTIVMLSICVTPIALLVLLVGIVRVATGAARRG